MRRAGRYVILEHEGSACGPHFDWMIEAGETLATWRVAVPPAEVSPAGAAAERIADHRTAYLSYEGPVSGGRGTVVRVEAGSYEADVEKDVWRVTLGTRAFVLARDKVTPG